MLLSNYYGLLMLNETAINGTRSFDSTSYENAPKIKNTSNQAMTSFAGTCSWGNYSIGSLSSSDVIIGSGTSAVTIADYCLQNPISTSKYSIVLNEPKIVYDGSTGQFYSDQAIIVACLDASGFTINEWGITRGGYLIYREVFETAYSLTQGETLTIRIRSSINTPLAE